MIPSHEAAPCFRGQDVDDVTLQRRLKLVMVFSKTLVIVLREINDVSAVEITIMRK